MAESLVLTIANKMRQRFMKCGEIAQENEDPETLYSFIIPILFSLVIIIPIQVKIIRTVKLTMTLSNTNSFLRL